MRRCRNKLTTLLMLSFTAFGCKTVSVWDGGYPKRSEALASDDAKKAEFRKFSIYESAATGDGRGWIQTQKDAETDTYYGLDSFGPVMTEVSPATKDNFDSIRASRAFEWVAVGLLLASIFVPHRYEDSDRGEKADRVGNGLFLGGLLTSIGTSLYQRAELDDAKTQYHRDLNKRVFGPTLSYAWTLGD